MSTTTETPISALAHCSAPRCAGHAQEPVPGIRRTVSHTYADLNGTAEGSVPGIERSSEYILFADHEADAACPHCGTVRQITDQRRPNYEPLSGHDPMGLLSLQDSVKN